MSVIPIPSSVGSERTDVNDEEILSTADNYSWVHYVQRSRRDRSLILQSDTILSFFRSGTPTLPLSNTDPITARSGEQIVPLRPQPIHVRNRGPRRGRRSRLLTTDGTSDQVTEGSRRQRSIFPSRRVVTDTGRISHINRKKEIEQILGPLLAESTNNVLLLCWGDKDRCHIIPTSIPHEANEVNIWESIRAAWYARRGHWRTYIPLYGVQQVDIVEVTMAGYESVSLGGEISEVQYLGLYREAEPANKRSELEDNIAHYEPQDFPCQYNPSTGKVNCSRNYCVSCIADDIECPENRLYESQRQLLHLIRRPLLTQAFSNENVANGNSLLKNEKLLYSHSDMLKKLDAWHVPDLSEIPFHALLITEGWDLGTRSVVIPLAMSFFFLLVVVSKVIYNDWGI
ncbi:hypothetical protein CA14_008224 [Aspergillus flavus]|uniref:Uncharacterized protein n=1 Tax=Aspergillus flavus TaxID=5059 RepID=A0AB74CMW2_ASPFL|nr:hypothetical protein CA14_008224 [Aspergillus flavus]